MEETITRLAREVDARRYGKYRGFVTNNKDPKRIGRVKLVVPSVSDSHETNWALPCLPFGGRAQQGFFFVPEKDSQVWVEFEEGDINRPIWTGVFWQCKEDLPQDAARPEPTTRVLQTKSGHLLQFDDADGQQRVRLFHAANAELTMENDGSVELRNAGGGTLKLDASVQEMQLEDGQGNTLTMNGSGILAEDSSGNRIEMGNGSTTLHASRVVVKAGHVALGGEGGEPVIKGRSFITQFMAHRHTVAPIIGGPTSPPVPQGEMSTLSTKVTTG